MGSFKSGLCAIALASLVGTAAVVGCSASGTDGVAGTTDPTVPPPDNTAVLPPATDSGDPPVVDASTDTSKKDSGPKPEAGVDAGPPPPVPGAACPTVNAVGTKPCGACGVAETLCLDDGTGTGKNKWTAYGQCTGEIPDGCTPGTIVTEDCGNCGKLTKTCNQFCAFAVTACAGQPVNNCKAGTLEYSGAGCPTASTYRNRTCGVACTWGAYSPTCEMPVNDIVFNIGAVAGATTTKVITFTAARVGTRLTGSCPSANLSAPVNHPYQFVEVHNPTAKAAKVTVYVSQPAGGALVDTVMTAYANPIQPMDDPSRKACRDGVNDDSFGDVALTGNTIFSILKAVAIPAGGSVLVWVGAYYELGEMDFAVPPAPRPTTGDLQMNALIETLN